MNTDGSPNPKYLYLSPTVYMPAVASPANPKRRMPHPVRHIITIPRIGGATFQVPMEVRPERKVSISMKNLVLYSRKRAGKSMAEKLAAEIVDAFNSQGAAFKRKEEMHRMAEANKAFAHFRF